MNSETQQGIAQMLIQKPTRTALTRTMALALCLVLTLACGLHKATVAFDEGRYDDALVEYRKALKKDPNNLAAKIGYRKAAPLAAEQHLVKARNAQKHGQADLEAKEVGMAVVLDPANAVAVDWLARLEQAAIRRRAQEEAEDSIDAERLRGEAKNALPINPRSLEGMDLNFTRKTSLKEIFQQLSRNSGVNIVLHSSASAQDVQVSVDLRGLSFQRVLDTLMLQSDLFYKVMDNNSIMVFKKTPQNLLEYENKLIRTFYLSNAEVENVRQIFNALMPQLKVFTDKRLNAITVMAKPTDLGIAQHIVDQLDKSKAEVMIYLELLEVAENVQEEFGLIPVITPADTSGTYAIGATASGAGTGLNQQTGSLSISKSSINYLFPSLRLDMAKTSGETTLLANPNVRVISGETGEVNIGDKISTTQSSIGVPSTATTGTTGTSSAISSAISSIGGVATAQTSYSYEDVGVKIKVKPRVHFNNDITIDLESEIKSLKAGGDPGRPNLTQRVIKTSARLRDGETAIFGGLLREDEAKNLQGLWGISDIPVVGSLLSNHNNTKTKTDVILTIRAVVVRKPDLAEDDFEAFDPDRAPNTGKPFEPKTPKKINVPMNAVPTSPAPSAPQAAPETPAPAAIPAPVQAPVPAPVQTPVPAPVPTPVPVPVPAAANAAADPAQPSNLVFFMNPLSLEVPKGQTIRASIMVSGAAGLTSGTLQLHLDTARLNLKGINAGDFITGDNGSLQSSPVTEGNLTLTFSRKTGASDSGTLANLDLEATDSGNATILIQGGNYLVGANPISANVVNGLIMVN